MESFALVSATDNRERIIKRHPFLRYLPKKYAKACLKYIPARKTGIIMDKEDHKALGYIIDVPGFFMGWDEMVARERMKNIIGIEKTLRALNVRILSFPLAYRYLNEREMTYLSSKGIIILDSHYQRLASLMLALRQLGFIMRKDLPFIEAGIWGADTDTGRAFVDLVAEKINHLCIGGSNRRELAAIADRVLSTTGLSCRITTDPRTCLNSKNIAILAEPVYQSYNIVRPSFHIRAYMKLAGQDISIRPDTGVYVLDMGWLDFPQDLATELSLEPIEELGVLEGLLYNISRVYREDILKGRLTSDLLNRIGAIYGLYPLKIKGFISETDRIHFDSVRMDYFRFRKKRVNDKCTRGNNIP